MKSIHVVAAIIKNGSKILIAQRSSGEFAGLWEFPGGKIEEGESLQDALKREIMEELELDINIEHHVTKIEYDYPSFHLTMDCFLCSLKNDKIHLHDHTAIQWLTLNSDITSIPWVPADVQVIHDLLNFINKYIC